VVASSTPDVAEGISVPLLKKMSSERTLAVQAELVRQPQKAVALMVWRLCSCVFHYCITTRHPFVMNLGVHHSSLTSEAPTGENGQAWQSLMQEKARLEALLPEGWKNDFTTFFALDGQTLMSLMASVPPVPWTASRPVNTDIPAAVTSTVSRRRSGSTCATGGSQRRITSSGYSAKSDCGGAERRRTDRGRLGC
jgi:hypothetical protein